MTTIAGLLHETFEDAWEREGVTLHEAARKLGGDLRWYDWDGEPMREPPTYELPPIDGRPAGIPVWGFSDGSRLICFGGLGREAVGEHAVGETIRLRWDELKRRARSMPLPPRHIGPPAKGSQTEMMERLAAEAFEERYLAVLDESVPLYGRIEYLAGALRFLIKMKERLVIEEGAIMGRYTARVVLGDVLSWLEENLCLTLSPVPVDKRRREDCAGCPVAFLRGAPCWERRGSKYTPLSSLLFGPTHAEEDECETGDPRRLWRLMELSRLLVGRVQGIRPRRELELLQQGTGRTPEEVRQWRYEAALEGRYVRLEAPASSRAGIEFALKTPPCEDDLPLHSSQGDAILTTAADGAAS